MFDETKETQNTDQVTVNPYLAGAGEPVMQDVHAVENEPVVQDVVVEEVPTAEDAQQVAEEIPAQEAEPLSQEQPEQSFWQAAPAASPIPEEPKKNPAVKVAIILAIVAVVLIIAIVALAFSGLFGNKKTKIAQAFKNTMEESETYLKEVWQTENYEGMFEGEESRVEVDFTLPEDITVEAVVDSAEEEAGMVMDLGMAGNSLLELEVYLNESQIFIAIPEYFDYLFYIDLETIEDDIQVMIDNNMIDSYTAETILDALEMQEDAVEPSEEAVEQLGKDLKAAWTDMFEAVKVKEIDSKELTVNDEDVTCNGYAIELTPAIVADLGEATLAAYQDNDEIMEFIDYLELSYDTDAVTEALSSLEEMVDELRDIEADEEKEETLDINVYLYDDKVARIDVTDPEDDDAVWFAWNIEGGSFPLENTSIEIDMDGDEIEIYRTGSMEDGEYWAEYEYVDEYGTSYIFNTFYVPETGEFEFDLMEDDYFNWLYTYGTIVKADDHTIEIEIDTLELDEEEAAYGDIVISDECGDIKKPEGEEEINILTLSEEELEELIMEAYMALY